MAPSGGTLAAQQLASAAPTTPSATAPPAAPNAGTIDCTSCWPTYAHDYQRTGYQPQSTGINSGNVATLTEKWAWPLNEQVVTSPVIDDGLLFVATGAGNVYAFNVSDGTIMWKRNLGGPILETPTIDHGSLYVGTHQPPSTFYSLDATTGGIQWQTTIPGDFRGPAAVSNGIVYVGEAGGDPPECDSGGVHGYQAATGAPLFFWQTDPKANDGGAVWSPISVDGGSIVFGTGNTCSDNVVNANSLIRLTSAGAQEWETPIGQPSVKDDDWGGGILVSNGRYFAVNKDGSFLSTNPTSGAILWNRPFTTVNGQGSIGTPTTDGSIIIVPSGDIMDANLVATPTASFSGFAPNGDKQWSFQFDFPQRNYAPIADRIAYLAEDDDIVAVDAHSGVKLWSYESSGNVEFIGAPAITSDGLFTVDTDGAVIVFAPAASLAAAQAAKSHEAITRGPLFEPYGSIIRKAPNGSNKVVY